MDDQLSKWFEETRILVEKFQNGVKPPDFLSLVNQTFVYEDIKCFRIQQLLIFNLDSTRADVHASLQLIRNSLVSQARLLDPLFQEERTALSPWPQIIACLCIISRNIRDYETCCLQLVIANLSTCCLLDLQPQYLRILLEFKKEIKERCIFNDEKFNCGLLVHRYFPLQKVVDFSHVTDVYDLNLLLMGVKFAPHDLKKEDFDNMESRKGLLDLSSLITFARVLHCKSKADHTNISKYLKIILENGNKSLEAVRKEALLFKGNELLTAGCHQLALAAFYQALKECPTSIRGLVGTSEALKLSGNIRSAIEVLKNIIKLQQLNDLKDSNIDMVANMLQTLSSHGDMSYPFIIAELANLQMVNQEYEEAVTNLLVALKKSCNEQFPQFIIQKLRIAAAFALLRSGNHKDSLVIANHLNSRKIGVNKRKLDPSEPSELVIYFLLAKCYLALDQNTRALTFYDKALKLLLPHVSAAGYPSEKLHHGDGGNTVKKVCDIDKETLSKSHCLSLEAYSKIRSRLYYEKSLVYSQTGDTRSQKQSLEAAVSLNPSNFILKQYVDFLDTNRDSQKDEKLDRVINNVPKDKINIDLTNLDIIPICIKSIIEDNF